MEPARRVLVKPSWLCGITDSHYLSRACGGGDVIAMPTVCAYGQRFSYGVPRTPTIDARRPYRTVEYRVRSGYSWVLLADFWVLVLLAENVIGGPADHILLLEETLRTTQLCS